MTRRLHIADGLALPASVATERLAFLGRTGSGKSYAALKLAELLYDAGAQFVALDPVGVWWGLRLDADGKAPGIAIPVFGGLHGDVPLEPTGGKLVADVIVDRGISAVIDVSQFESDAEKARFAADFAERFFHRKKRAPSAVHVFLEEAQEFVPQNIQRGEERMLHVWQRLVRLGRNFGIGVTLITQRPQDVNKKALNMAEVLFAFQTTGPQERKAIDIWMADKGLDQDIAADLPKLQVGEAHAWSPSLLRISKQVKISERHTFDASSTPKVGGRAAVRELAPIDMAELGDAMRASVEKAKAEDPKLLHARIRELEAALKKRAPADPAAVDKAVAAAREHASSEILLTLKSLEKDAKGLKARADELREQVGARFAAAMERLLAIAGAEPDTASAPHATNHERAALPRRMAAARVARAPASGEAFSLRRGERKMLDTLARRHPVAITRAQLATLAGLSPSSGTFSTYLGTLKREGLFDDPGDGTLLISADGFAHLGMTEPPAPLTSTEVLDQWRSAFRAGERRMLDTFVEAYPKTLTRAQLSERTEMSMTSGTFSTYLGTLRRNGLLEICGPTMRLAPCVMGEQ